MEWIKAMTEEMKGPIRQFSEKTRQKVEKVDQLALEEVSKCLPLSLMHLNTYVNLYRFLKLLVKAQNLCT